jgi:Leucine-rich repeat (LRR) protein
MALKINESPWLRLILWAYTHQKQSAYKCVLDVLSLSAWETEMDPVSIAWRCVTYFSTHESLNTDSEKFVALKKRLLEYVETVPEGDSLSIPQMEGIQAQIEQNETLAEMWNCTKKYYFDLARKGEVDNEFPDYAFGFTSSGSLIERVKAIQAQIDSLNRPRSQALETVTHWSLCHTSLTLARMPKMISQEFTNITVLDMSHNKFLVLGDFSRFNKLRELYLSDNCLREIPAAHLPLFLEVLALDRNHLDQQPDLTRLVLLKVLNISGNPFGAGLNMRLLPSNLEKTVS